MNTSTSRDTVSETTPMMLQYRRIKAEYGDAILFFRLGDFYEMFDSDAREASGLLDITLTKRSGVPMCGIPYHAAQSYIARLMKAGKKIAICEQVSQPKPGPGIVERQVFEVVTPGTVVDEEFLDRRINNYLLALGRLKDSLSIAYIDVSTSAFYATSFPFTRRDQKIREILIRLSPREIIVQESLLNDDQVVKKALSEQEGIVVNRFPDWSFDAEVCSNRLKKQLSVANLKGFGLSDDAPEVISAGVILDYMSETSKGLLPHINNIQIVTDSMFVGLDDSTQRNLELVRNIHDGSEKYTLMEVLDQTKTALGTRYLRRTVLCPLKDLNEIEKRLASVSFFYKNQVLLSNVRSILSRILDLERLSAKLSTGRANAKDLLAVNASLAGVCCLCELLAPHQHPLSTISVLLKHRGEVEIIEKLIESSIVEEPSLQFTEGNLIKAGYNQKLDDLRKIKENARGVMESYLQEEKEKTGILSLKLKQNRILGHFLEVTKPNAHLVPQYFIKKQSLVHVERYTTEGLLERETEITSASVRIVELERDLFLDVREQVSRRVSLFFDLCHVIAEVDLLQCFAFAATVNGFTCPIINDNGIIKIIDGRHPVVEANLPSGSFVPNSVFLDQKKDSLALITGPNMAGKSTFLRQVALIVLLAHIGSFVPASEAQIGLVDKIFCRVGAADNLARGESTFMVEMNEAAHILRTATEKSLLILDEIGRGTGTNDGLAIAWAVTEHILEQLKAKTMFATHFHELTALKHEKLVNLSMDVLEKDGSIVFLKRVKKGPSDNSYGIHVAELAGIPQQIVTRAKNILSGLTKEEKSVNSSRLAYDSTLRDRVSPHKQLSLFSIVDLVEQEIIGIDVNRTTPLEALDYIAKWKADLKKNGRITE